MNINDLFPGDIAGFDLAAWKLPDGSYQLSGSKKIITEFPKEITCNNITYTLEEIFDCGVNQENGLMFINAIYV